MTYLSTHSLGVKCSLCGGVLVSDNCRCGKPHGFTFQDNLEYAKRTWPDHVCGETENP